MPIGVILGVYLGYICKGKENQNDYFGVKGLEIGVGFRLRVWRSGFGFRVYGFGFTFRGCWV